jgi:hypothetical protein
MFFELVLAGSLGTENWYSSVRPIELKNYRKNSFAIYISKWSLNIIQVQTMCDIERISILIILAQKETKRGSLELYNIDQIKLD